jgi:protein-tyrosine phosphatase
MKRSHLDWPDCRNARDLGGLPTRDGGRIRDRALMRSDNHTKLSEAGIAAVRAAGISRIIDVRSGAECAHDPSPFATEPFYRNLPIEREGDPWDPDGSLAQGYVAMLERNPDLFARAVAAIADAPPGAVAVHCHAGKDRAGTVIALALSLADVTPETVAADYAILSEEMRSDFAAQVARIEDLTERAQLAEAFTAAPETMLELLRQLDRQHGGAEGYLRSGGMTAGQVESLRHRLCEPVRAETAQA